jgi:DNA (cytosine-5)-methyltransferase 1
LIHTTHTLRGEGFDANEDGTGRGTPLVPVAIGSCEVAGTLTSNYGKQPDSSDSALGPNLAIAFDCKASGQSGFGVGEIASTQRAMGHANSHTNGGGHQAVMTGMQVRRLTPLECERLQGFPDNWTLVPHNGKPAADGPRYKALGNSMAVPVMAWIGQRIQMVEEMTVENVRMTA